MKTTFTAPFALHQPLQAKAVSHNHQSGLVSARRSAGTDSVHFSGTNVKGAEATLKTYALQLLTQAQLKPGQKLKIEADSFFLPLVRQMVEAAYREKQSGLVWVDMKEPELEKLKKQYGITEDFDFVRQQEETFASEGAAVIRLKGPENHYVKAGLSPKQTEFMIRNRSAQVSPQTRQLLQIAPDEILEECLHLKPGQPVQIVGTREQLPIIAQLVERAYQRGTRLVEVKLQEDKRWDLSIPFFKYASDAVLTEVPAYSTARLQEFVDKNIAAVFLEGSDPALLSEVDSARISMHRKAKAEHQNDLELQLMSETPWVGYYSPTTISAKAAGYKKLKDAARDAKQINHVGHLAQHIERLKQQAEQLNALVRQGYRTLRFVSVDSQGRPDGKTDLNVGLTQKSIFVSAEMTTPSGHRFMANVPSEESFTAPDRMKTNGVVSITMPISINGKRVEGIRMEFKDGRIARDEQGKPKVTATQNLEELLTWLESAENVDMLGEIALVDKHSPIAKMNRFFDSILLDENRTSHFALGAAYPDTIEGAMDITDPDARIAYATEQGANADAEDHLDFMIGGPNVQVIMRNDDNGKELTVIKNNEFQFRNQAKRRR